MDTPHIALYRKYRPQSFNDVVGQEQAVAVLSSALQHNKVSHAYLFCGGRGTGKTTVARIVARDVGCNDEDIIEIDAASNRGIDEIRELRDAVRLAPFSSKYKVYIIDEAHMLTKEAANALLKTLEEPPSHIIFILATTDPEKLPPTIVSRCQKIVFKNPDTKTLAERLQYIAEKEGCDLNQDAAYELARIGKHSYRDAVGALEQVLHISPQSISLETVRANFALPEDTVLTTLLTAVCEKNGAVIIKTLASMSSLDATKTYDTFIELVRKGLMARIGGGDKESDVAKIALAHPHTISSKLVLELLENRHLVTVSEIHGWIAFEAILLSAIEA